MENHQSPLEFEKQRLAETISLAKEQIEQARQSNEENKEAIISAKQEMRENASHSISNLWGSDGFEALAELSQYMNPVMNKIASYEATEHKIAQLEQLVQSPYFARIDFQFDGEDTPEKIYIGRSSLMDDSSYETYVYDWRSPIASVFYRFVLGEAFYESPNGKITGKVHLKRQYEINGGILDYFFDADIQIVDEFLRKLLSQNTSPKMKTIVETIQKEQDMVIRDVENDLMMVQGVAGSGKTSIALHRAAYLMYQGLSTKLSAHNIMIISPNTVFEQYISNVLPELGEENVVSVVFEELLKKILKNRQIQSRNEFLEHFITSSRYKDMMKRSIELKTSDMFLELLQRWIEDLPYRWIPFEDVYYHGRCVVTKEKLRSRILSGRKATPLGLRLKQLEDYILGLIHATKEKPISNFEEALLRKDFQRFTELNLETLYQEFLMDKEYLYELGKDIELPDCMDAIREFTLENLGSHCLQYDDAAVLAYLYLKIKGNNQYRAIKQVVIDEAQDYYPLHFEIFHLLFPNSKFTVLGDINQTLEKQETLSLYEQIRKTLNKKKSSLSIMNKSFRCTNEILNYSAKFLQGDSEIKSFNRTGDQPEVYEARDMETLIDNIVSEAMFCLEKGYKSIGLICKTEKNALALFPALKDSLDIQLVKKESAVVLEGVFIIPVYLSKGLEFDAVLICDVDSKNYQSQEDKKLLYIACTRALHRLNLFCTGEASPLLQE